MMRRAMLKLLAMQAGMGLRGTMPQRPDQGSQPPSGVIAPTQAAGILRARTVIISGTGTSSGVFVYNGTPGPGNPPIASMTSGTTDPFGNSVVPADTGYVTIGPGTGAGRYAIALGDQSSPFGQFAALTLQNLTTPANLPPGVTGQVDSVLGASLNLESGKLTSADVGTSIQMSDNNAIAPSIQVVADFLSIGPASSGAVNNTQITGFLSMSDQASSPAGIAGQGVIWIDSTGFPLMMPDTNSGDTTKYQIGHRELFSTTDQDVISTTFATVCGGATVGAGTYRVRAVLTVTQNTAAVSDHYRLGFTGTISQVRMVMQTTQDNTSVFVATTTSNNGLLASHGYGVGTTYIANFDGIIKTTSSGTLSIQAAESAAGDDFSVLALSFFEIIPAN